MYKESSVLKVKKGVYIYNENGNLVELSNGVLVDLIIDDENKKVDVGVNNVVGKGLVVED